MVSADASPDSTGAYALFQRKLDSKFVTTELKSAAAGVMNRNAYKLPVRGTGVGSEYSMADSMRGSTLSGGGDAPPVELPKAMHDAGDRKTFDAVSMCVVAFVLRRAV